MKQFISGCLAILLFMTVAVNAEASPQVIEAVGVAIMGDNDSPKAAKEAARKEAMRQAVEKAGYGASLHYNQSLGKAYSRRCQSYFRCGAQGN